MNKKAKKYIFLALTALGLYGLYMLVMVLLGQPFFVLLLTYAAVIIIIYLINRKNAWAVRGNYFYLMGHHANAKPLLDKAIAANTKSPSAYIYRALLFMREDNDAKKAQELLEKAKPLCSTTIEERNLITALASCLWLDGRVDEGIEALEDMRARHEYVNAGVLTTLGYMYFCKGENEKAIEITEQAMADDQNTAQHGTIWGKYTTRWVIWPPPKKIFMKHWSERKTLRMPIIILA